jgi:hypothetical protein
MSGGQQSSCPTGLVSAGQNCACASGFVTKVANFQPRASADCVALTCESPLVMNLVKNGCIGCSNGTAGIASIGCGLCASSTPDAPFFCPGLTGTRVLSTAFGLPDSYTSSCRPLIGNNSLTHAGTPAPKSGFFFLTGLTQPDTVIAVALALALAITALYTLASTLGKHGACSRVLSCVRTVDLFSKEVWVPDGERQLRRRRPIGGYFSIMGLLGFATAALVLITLRNEDNVISITSANILGIANEALVAQLPFKSDAGWGAGVQVRIAAAGAPGACAAPTFSATGYSSNAVFSRGGALEAAGPGAWVMTTTPACGATNASQIVLSCAGCSLSSTTELKLSFHYSCQTFSVQVGALDAAGVVTALESGATADGLAGARLTALSFSADLFYNVLNDTRTKGASTRGYAIANMVASSQSAPLPLLGGGLQMYTLAGSNQSIPLPLGSPFRPTYATIVPQQSSVALNIALKLNVMFSSTTLAEKQSIAALLASIVGLAAIVGFGGKLMIVTDMVKRKIDPEALAIAMRGYIVHAAEATSSNISSISSSIRPVNTKVAPSAPSVPSAPSDSAVASVSAEAPTSTAV